MRYHKTINTIRNIFWGSMNKSITILLPFVNRTIIIYVLGLEYAGLDSLFLSVLKILNLAELGIGTALTYSMYEPIAQNDNKKICAILKLYRQCYRIISFVTLFLGLILLPFLHLFVRGDVPEDVNIYILFLLYIFQNFSSYSFFAYKSCLLSAHQRLDVGNRINIILNILMMGLQAFIILITRNYYLYLIPGIVSVILLNIFQAVIADKMFPEYRCVGELTDNEKKTIFKQVTGLLTNKIGAVVINAADTLVISAFLGLKQLAIYDNYYYCLAAVSAFFDIILNSMTAGIGNSIIIESKENNRKLFNTINFIYQWLVTCAAALLLCLYQPFIHLWVGKDNLFSIHIVFFLVFRFFAGRIVQVTFMYKDALGLWWEDRFRPVISAVCNLVINIVLVNLIGIEGVIISTFLCTICISTPWGNMVLYKQYFGRGLKQYYIKLCYTYMAGFITVFASYIAAEQVKTITILSLILRFVVCLFVTNVFLILLNYRREEFKDAISKIRRKMFV